MAKRPALSEDSFLAHIFSPKKNPLPTGLRVRPIAMTKGRKAARVNAYNKMPAVKQELLKRSGQRDAFLRGEVTYASAKQLLRVKAVTKGIVRPIRTKVKTGAATPTGSGVDLARYLLFTLRKAGKSPNVSTVVAGSAFNRDDDAMTLTFDQIKERASDPEYMMRDSKGTEFNPYWYN